MNENELRQALAGHATSVVPTADVDRFAAGMARVDRMRSIKIAGLACLATAAVTFGAVSFTHGEDAAPLDIVDQPNPTLPDSEVALPVVDDADSETAITVPATTTTPSAATGIPDHLAENEQDVPATTVAVVTTTQPVTTTVPPTTTQSPTTTTTGAAVVFTANARYESCAEDPSYDEYSGTATPGMTITVTSPYNSAAQVTADGNGDWWIRVEFPTAPVNTPFNVTVGDGTSSSVFDMIHTA